MSGKIQDLDRRKDKKQAQPLEEPLKILYLTRSSPHQL
jgi:hypothetical protein